MFTSSTRREPSMRRGRTALRTTLALAAALVLAVPMADARPGGGGSVGSRGSRTYNAPSATPTAPGTAAPMQRTQTAPSPGLNGAGQVAQNRPRFGGGFLGGLLGAGLLGALLGAGFAGGLGGFGSFLGLILQIGLVVLLASLAFRWFRRRSEQPAAAGAPYARDRLDGGAGGQGGGQGAPAAGPTGGMFGGGRAPQQRPVQIGPNDYQAFERLLGEVQEAYGHEDMVSLRNIATPEMAGYFEEELRANAARGVVNRISGVKLQQGDLSEAWGEGDREYATVAMRYSLTDVTLDRRSQQVVERGAPEAVELWTFVRAPGRAWILSAIQQTR